MCALLRNSVSVERPAAAGHTLLKHVCFVVLRETGTAGAGVAEILWAEFWNGWSFFEVTTHCNEWVSLHQDDLRSCEQSSVEIIIFLSPLPPLQGCSWVMTSLLHLAGTLRIMSWLGMSHHSGNPVCVEAIAQISSTQSFLNRLLDTCDLATGFKLKQCLWLQNIRLN